jgi:cyclopropane fatty-acyl-phospholipid synthase-like methyltransferase
VFELASLGFKVIGLENNPELVARGNAEVKARGKEKETRFIEGDALAAPFVDGSFDALVDVGLLQHFKKEDHVRYVAELARLVKQGGLVFLVVLSKVTKQYLSWPVRESDTSEFTHEGVHYYFFSDEELDALLLPSFSVVHREYDAPQGPDDAVFATLLLRKK